MNSYLVTGGCGFIGVNLISRLALDGHKVRILDNLSVGKREHADRLNADLVFGDVRDLSVVREAIAGADAVVHLAAHTSVIESVSNPEFDFEVNALGTLNLLRASKECGVRRFVFASTGGAILGEQSEPVHEGMVPRPISPYGASKLAGEGLCSAFFGSAGLDTVALRFSNVYGPHSAHKKSAVAHFIMKILQGETICIFGDGEQTRDFLYVDDVVNAICRCLSEDAEGIAGEAFQIATGCETTINRVVGAIGALASGEGYVVDVIHKPERAGEVRRNCARIDKARNLLGYRPAHDLDTGLANTWRWFLDEWRQTQAARPATALAADVET
ncbi:MAG TPA: NAD-dependent epimerase/dehydratase family protein [Terriglobia bacterium]|nr:NAD-dependent epimerase/dehydratase family protein [Terriglobia bacterium]